MKPYDFPDAKGHFGPYGGVFVAETLMHALDELRAAYDHYRVDPAFLEEFNYEGATAIGIAMLVISFVLLLVINAIQVWSRRRIGYV